MSTSFLYPKLAASGIKKNRRIYLPYILAGAGMIMMYYITSFLSVSGFVAEMRGGGIMQVLLVMGCWVLAVFSAIFLFYTNSFLIRRRKTEFGLYNVLGMGKRNIARVLVWETLIVYALAEAAGIGCGILFSKFAELLLTKMMGNEASYSFSAEPKSICDALALYAVIFLLILINALRQIHLSNPVELLRSENAGEKPPKANWLLALLGAVLLCIAYYIAVTIESPLAAIFAFLAAVIMVILATYLLFIAGSVAMCKILQSNKKYYYKTNHFVSVSQMTYRMKRNGAGLASICILSTMVLVTLSSTTCLFAGMEDMLGQRYPRDILVNAYSIDEEDVSLVKSFADGALEKYGETPRNEFEYRYISISGALDGDSVTLDPADTDASAADAATFTLIPVEDYNKITGKNISLARDEVLISSSKSEFDFDEIGIQAVGSFKIKDRADDFIFRGETAAVILPEIYLFVADIGVLEYVYEKQLEVYGERYASSLHNYYGFDLDCDDDTKIKIYNEIHFNAAQYKKTLEETGKESDWCGYRIESRENERADFFALYGGLFFLGVVFGTVFICAAALIMYYKQISEGFEDKSKYDILQKVGMTETEIRKSINSQVLTVFFLPLAAAGLHMAFAFPIVSRLLLLFGLTNTALFAAVTLCCFGAFSLVYAAVYIVTSRSYCKIVSTDKD
ncbi:MAG: ABC transporter permease [Prevotella sp.]|nr:ABC transporter permease [Prevotella sp.]